MLVIFTISCISPVKVNICFDLQMDLEAESKMELMENSDAAVDLAARMALLARQVLYFTLLFTPCYLRIFLNQDDGDITIKLQGGDQIRRVHSNIIFAK